MDSFQQRIVARIQQRAVTSQADIRNLEHGLLTALERRLTTEHHRMEIIEGKVRSLDPTLLLKRGYSMTMKDGKIVRDTAALHPGDEIETRLANGTVRSTVIPSDPLNP